MIGIILLIIGFITMFSSFLFVEKSYKIIFTILIIGIIIAFIGAGMMMSTAECQSECQDRNLIFSHQEYNQCSEELTCYCKQPIAQPKPKVVIIE